MPGEVRCAAGVLRFAVPPASSNAGWIVFVNDAGECVVELVPEGVWGRFVVEGVVLHSRPGLLQVGVNRVDDAPSVLFTCQVVGWVRLPDPEPGPGLPATPGGAPFWGRTKADQDPCWWFVTDRPGGGVAYVSQRGHIVPDTEAGRKGLEVVPPVTVQ